MKKSILTILTCLIAAFVFAQEPKKEPVKQDTIIQITMKLSYYRSLLAAIDQNIDSKKLSSEIFALLQKSAQIVQPADKPKK